MGIGRGHLLRQKNVVGVKCWWDWVGATKLVRGWKGKSHLGGGLGGGEGADKQFGRFEEKNECTLGLGGMGDFRGRKTGDRKVWDPKGRGGQKRIQVCGPDRRSEIGAWGGIDGSSWTNKRGGWGGGRTELVVGHKRKEGGMGGGTMVKKGVQVVVHSSKKLGGEKKW